jgi:hypothetical protein
MWNHAPIEPGSLKTATVRPPDQGNAPLVGDVTGLGTGGGVGLGMNADSSFGNIRLSVGLNPAASGSMSLFWPVAPPAAANGISFTADWATLVQAAAAGPTIDFDFTTMTVLDPSIAFTRASAATDGFYTDPASTPVTSFAINAPRLDGRGLLLENARTNFLLNSGAPVTQTTGNLPANLQYSLWVQGPGSVTVTPGTAVTTGLPATATQGVPAIFTVNTTGTVTATVAGSLTRFQLEGNPAPGYPTTYIPTLGGGVVRAVDLGQLPTAAWFNAAEGSVVVDFRQRQLGPTVDLPGLFTDANNNMEMRLAGSASFLFVFNGNVNTGVLTTSTSFIANATQRAAFTYKVAGGAIQHALNGVTVGGVASSFPTIAQARFGAVRTAAQDGFTRRWRYYPRALSPAELNNLTAPSPVGGVPIVLNWTANRPLIPGDVVRIPYRWNTSN